MVRLRRARAGARYVRAALCRTPSFVFLGSAPVKRTAADTIKALEGDLASAPPKADLVDALKELAARIGAAANELT